MPDFVSDFDPGPGEPSLESGVGLEMPDLASDFDPWPGKLSPESGDMFPGDVTFPCLDVWTSAVTPDPTSYINRKPGKPCQIPGDIHFMCMDAPVSDDAGVGNRLFSETPDLAGDFHRTLVWVRRTNPR